MEHLCHFWGPVTQPFGWNCSQDKRFLYVVMERVKGGELFEAGSNRLQVDTTRLWVETQVPLAFGQQEWTKWFSLVYTVFTAFLFEHCWCIQKYGHPKIIGFPQWSLSDVADLAVRVDRRIGRPLTILIHGDEWLTAWSSPPKLSSPPRRLNHRPHQQVLFVDDRSANIGWWLEYDLFLVGYLLHHLNLQGLEVWAGCHHWTGSIRTKSLMVLGPIWTCLNSRHEDDRSFQGFGILLSGMY